MRILEHFQRYFMIPIEIMYYFFIFPITIAVYRGSEIAKATDFLKDWDAYTPTPWLPIIDAKHVKKDPFIPENPIELIKKGNFNKMPTLIGHTKNEGVYNKLC